MRLAAAGVCLLVVIALPLAARRLGDEIYHRYEPEVVGTAAASSPSPPPASPSIVPPVKPVAAGGSAPIRLETLPKPDVRPAVKTTPATGPALERPTLVAAAKSNAAGGVAPPKTEIQPKPEIKPAAKAAAKAALVPSPRVIEVQRGDTLDIIAERHRVSISAILTANNMMTTSLVPGQRLVIPR